MSELKSQITFEAVGVQCEARILLHSDGTPAVGFSYDTGTNRKGQLTNVTKGGASTGYTDFDVLGNVLSSVQTTNGNSYTFGYTYNLAGALLSETYPSGRVVTTGYDQGNRPSSVSGVFGGTATSYVSGIGYAPQGALSAIGYGNGLSRSLSYNSRLQPTDILDSKSGQRAMEMCPSWVGLTTNGTINSACYAGSGGGNNGNLNGMSLWHGDASFTQTYAYDNTNRLTGAAEAGGWSQSYGYDQPGNMWVTGASQLPANPQMPVSNIYNAKNQNPNSSYDAAGNQTTLGSMTFSYDAENRQVGASSLGGGVFQYDGMGQRVRKSVGPSGSQVSTVYVYDAFGQMAAEYSSQAAGTPLCTTCYLSYDHLGSVRMVTDQSGMVVARHDYAPYGVEVQSGVGGRTNVWGVSTDVDVKFTGQVRDTETGEDYFNARYLASNLGRFMSADPGNAGADLSNPQSWQGYAYVGGNPLNSVDPSGMAEQGSPFGAGWDNCYSAEYAYPCYGIPSGSGGGYGGGGGFSNGGGGGGGSVSASPGSSTPLPPGSFPGGETLGLPPGMSVPLPGIGVLLGQGNDCEFGVCGILPSVGLSNPASQQLSAAALSTFRDFLKGVRVWISGRDPGNQVSPNAVRWAQQQTRQPLPRIYGNWCGPGGSGNPEDHLDRACLAHDYCYYLGGFGATDNLKSLPSNRAAQLQSCNQAFCNVAAQSGGLAGWEMRLFFTQVPGSANACQ